MNYCLRRSVRTYDGAVLGLLLKLHKRAVIRSELYEWMVRNRGSDHAGQGEDFCVSCKHLTVAARRNRMATKSNENQRHFTMPATQIMPASN